MQDEDRERRDRDHDGRVDDPLHDDRPEGRGARHALAITDVVRPDQLPEPRRQDVVGEIPDQQVAQHPDVPDVLDRVEQALPAQGPQQHVERLEPEHRHDPDGIDASERLGGAGEVGLREDEREREDRDDDPDQRPQRAPGSLHAVRTLQR